MAEPRRKQQGDLDDFGKARFVIVEARFYDDIADALLSGARRVLDEAGVIYDIFSVPGALEIPAAIAMVIDSRYRLPSYHGAIALGCVIRGETFHFEIVAEQSARALMNLSVSRKLPLGNGILTVDTEAQAWARAKIDEGDKGGDAARAALAMCKLKRQLEMHEMQAGP